MTFKISLSLWNAWQHRRSRHGQPLHPLDEQVRYLQCLEACRLVVTCACRPCVPFVRALVSCACSWLSSRVSLASHLCVLRAPAFSDGFWPSTPSSLLALNSLIAFGPHRFWQLHQSAQQESRAATNRGRQRRTGWWIEMLLKVSCGALARNEGGLECALAADRLRVPQDPLLCPGCHPPQHQLLRVVWI